MPQRAGRKQKSKPLKESKVQQWVGVVRELANVTKANLSMASKLQFNRVFCTLQVIGSGILFTSVQKIIRK